MFTGTFRRRVERGGQEQRHEWLVEPHRLEFAAVKGARYTVYDHWIDIPEDAFMSDTSADTVSDTGDSPDTSADTGDSQPDTSSDTAATDTGDSSETPTDTGADTGSPATFCTPGAKICGSDPSAVYICNADGSAPEPEPQGRKRQRSCSCQSCQDRKQVRLR